MISKMKTKRKVNFVYSKEALIQATEAIKNGETVFTASKKFGVPYATLHSRANGKYDTTAKKGPSTVFNKEEEKELVEWILQMSKRGFPINKDHLLDAVQSVVRKSEKNTPFTAGRPSRHWYEAFLKRNPELSLKMCQNLTKARSNVSEKSFRDWFAEVGDYLDEKKLKNIHGTRVFNLDESAFMLCPKSDKVLVQKGDKNIYNVCKSDKECYTALIGGNAAGKLLPPMVLFNYERIPKSIADNFPSDFVIGKSDTGWMTSDTFYSYIVNHFYPWCITNEIDFPVILYVDGHSSHLTKALSDFCCEHEIELIGLVPNATHLHQPMDVGLFHPLKTAYKTQVREWRLLNNGEHPTKVSFSTVLKSALNSLNLKSIFKSSFAKCGLHPFDVNNIDYTKLIQFEIPSVAKPIEEGLATPVIPTEPVYENLHFIESRINTDTLKSFKENLGQDWKGAAEFKEFFLFWSKCVEQSVNSMATNRAEPAIIEIGDNNSINISLHDNEVSNDTDQVVVQEIDLHEGTLTNEIPDGILDELVDDGIVNVIKGNTNLVPTSVIHEQSSNKDINTCDIEKPEYPDNDPANPDDNHIPIDLSIPKPPINRSLSDTNENPITPSSNQALTNGSNTFGSTLVLERKTNLLSSDSPSQQAFFSNGISQYLFYPKKEEKNKTKKKKERLPPTATSQEWRLYHDLKSKQKSQDEEAKAQRKSIKDNKSCVKKENEVNVKKLREDKENVKNQLSELKLKIQKNKAEHKLVTLDIKMGNPELKEPDFILKENTLKVVMKNDSLQQQNLQRKIVQLNADIKKLLPTKKTVKPSSDTVK